ncbi:hypothetical protein ACFO1B_23790 [Dactylosporangium siamense]|uniref:DUF1963 domain-containing protein n=1 Tax=Dactylosporangium siamense TaxID=685454 RepID=A0A919PRW4_9ACTN|nr:hypothetical protein [Dactylosporangium siamense]GIG47223.1 hypothetical protein Dsi01nite_052640 [Dactylosporangium siamense]
MITSPPSAEALQRFPALARHSRTATRLHPRPADVTMHDSHVGGPLLWPADEPWPTCGDKREVEDQVPLPDDLVERMRAAAASRRAGQPVDDGPALDRDLRRAVGGGYTGWIETADGRTVGQRTLWRRHQPRNPLLPVAQLRAADVPDLPRPKGVDLLQVLWCPAQHKGPPWGPVVRLRWRRQADVIDPLTVQPVSEVDHPRYALRTCRLSPERVVEHAPLAELPPRLRQEVESWNANYDALAVAPGWKAGGYTTWPTTGFRPTPCSTCAGRTRLALVIATSECGGGWSSGDREPDEPTGVLIGHYGAMRIFVCVRCPGTPFIEDIQ